MDDSLSVTSDNCRIWWYLSQATSVFYVDSENCAQSLHGWSVSEATSSGSSKASISSKYALCFLTKSSDSICLPDDEILIFVFCFCTKLQAIRKRCFFEICSQRYWLFSVHTPHQRTIYGLCIGNSEAK
uniref:Uncharacterized protein n=1 Tax=Oryza brachyantha TaxID=4533 RepID=J3N5F9_ORYBR